MAETLKLMCVLAHPDDEALGTGPTLARYGAEGVELSLLMATRGERGWQGEAQANPGLQPLGQLREAELRAAAERLGIGWLRFLGYVDGDLDQADPAEAIARIVAALREVRPQVVITFGPDGAYGHPDHIAISQFATAAIVCAADAGYPVPSAAPPHRVSKLYYMAMTPALGEAYVAAFGDIVMAVDGVERRGVAWNEWAITTWVDTAAHWRTAWAAILCHRSQLPGYQALEQLSDAHQLTLWGTQTYYRAFSTVNGGRRVETDLFEGLRG